MNTIQSEAMLQATIDSLRATANKYRNAAEINHIAWEDAQQRIDQLEAEIKGFEAQIRQMSHWLTSAGYSPVTGKPKRER